jgi:hypothetical protein
MEGQRLRVVENRLLRGIFGSMKEEVTGEWETLFDMELHNFHASK